MNNLKKECSVLDAKLKEAHLGLSLYDTHFDVTPELKLFRVIDTAIAAYTLDSAIDYYQNHTGVEVDINDDDVYEFSESDLDDSFDELDDNEKPTGNKIVIRDELARAKEFDFVLGWEM